MSGKREDLTVVLDTNVWISNRLLRSKLGESLLFFLDRIGGKLGLPEIVEMEVRARTRDLVMEEIERARRSLEHIGAIVGKPIAVPLPDDGDVTDAITRRIEWLKPLLDKSPFTLPQSKDALTRVIDRIPPCKTRQEFRDAALWEAVLGFAGCRRKVLFVTEDRDFCESRDLKKGLATALKHEIRDLELDLEVLFKLGDAISLLSDEAPKVDQRMLLTQLLRALKPSVVTSALEKEFAIGRELEYPIDYYPTADPKTLVVVYEIAYELHDMSGTGAQARSDASVTVKGECTYKPFDNLIENISFDTLAYAWLNSDGSRERPRTLYASAGIRASSSLGSGSP